MKKIIGLFFLLVSIGSFAQQELSWEFYHPIKKEWFSFGKAGSIQEKLMETGELPDPFFGDNDKLYHERRKFDFEFSQY